MTLRRTSVLLALAPIAACDGATSAPPGHGFEVKVAPLSIVGIDEACYDLLVSNGTDTVFSVGDPNRTLLGADQVETPATGTPGMFDADTETICSGQFGNGSGGGITYIGTCDASTDSDNNPDNGVQNSVTLWVDGLYAGGNEIGDWQDPCPNGCTLSVDCNENQDSAVDFDLTIMRRAKQGFFDVAVNFEDVFCSSKYDTCYAVAGVSGATEDQRIELLFGDGVTDGPGRDATGVLALACTGGADTAEKDVDTTLLYSDLRLLCTGGGAGQAISLPLDVESGNHDVAVSWDGGATTQNLQYATYYGVEQLSCGEGLSCNKKYLNVAIDLEDIPDAWTCRIEAEATATGGPGTSPLENGALTKPGSSYPFVRTYLRDMKACQQNPLDGTDSGVNTIYGTTFDADDPTHTMCYTYDGEGHPVAIAGAATAVDKYATEAEARVPSPSGFGEWKAYLGRVRSPCGGPSARDLVNYDKLFLTPSSNRFVTAKVREFTPASFDLATSVKVRVTLVRATGEITYLVGDATGGVAWSAIDVAKSIQVGPTAAGDYMQLELRTPAGEVPDSYPDAGIDLKLSLAFYVRS